MKTLFVNPRLTIESFEFRYKIKISYAFADLMDKKLTALFIKDTNLPIGLNVSISIGAVETFYVEKDSISKMPFCIYINHNWNPVIVAWSSKSGKVYDITDAEIDETDIKFWFEGLDPILYYKQLYPNETLPFKLKKLSYELNVNRLNKDCEIILNFIPSNNEYSIEGVALAISKWLEKFNETSEKKDREFGVLNSWSFTINRLQIVYLIDNGSTGVYYLKKFLQYLSNLNCFSKVTIN